MHPSITFIFAIALLPACFPWSTSPLTFRQRSFILQSIPTSSDNDLIQPIAASILLPSLQTKDTIAMVREHTGLPAVSYVPDTLFEPVPYSTSTPHGMPQHIHESYHSKKSRYVVINVPPKLLFDAGVFKPGKLCAVYELEHDDFGDEIVGDKAAGRANEDDDGVMEFTEEGVPGDSDDVWKGLGGTIASMFESQQNEEEEDDDDFNYEDYMV